MAGQMDGWLCEPPARCECESCRCLKRDECPCDCCECEVVTYDGSS